jgi:hypothetical protein
VHPSDTTRITDALSNNLTYGRRNAAWTQVPSLTGVGTGVFNPTADTPSGYLGLYTITNQPGAAGWPATQTDNAAFMVVGYGSNAGWPNKLLMSGRYPNTGGIPFWFQTNDTTWHEVISDRGGTFKGGLTFNSGVSFGQATVTNASDTSRHITLWQGFGGLSVTGGRLNVVGGAIYMVHTDNTDLAHFDSAGLAMHATKDITLARAPSANMHATNMQWVQQNFAPIVGGGYLPMTGGDLSGKLGVAAISPANANASTVTSGVVATSNLAINTYYATDSTWKALNNLGGGLIAASGSGLALYGVNQGGATGATVTLGFPLLLNYKGNVGLRVAIPVNQATASASEGGWYFGWGLTAANHGSNIYYDGAGWRYLGAGAASVIQHINGYLTFSNAPSGAVDGAATLTTRLTVDAAGNMTLTGQATATSVQVRNGGGYIRLEPAGVGQTGYTAHFNNAGTRIGYIGFADGTWFNLHTESNTSGLLITSPQVYTTGDISVGGNGIIYRGFTGNRIAFNWDGPNACINQFIDGTFQGTVATRGWAAGTFKGIGAYTPNQNVDYGSGPTFSYVGVTGDTVCHNVYNDGGLGVMYRGLGQGHWIGFGWNNSWLTLHVDGGYQYQIVSPEWVGQNFKHISAYTPNQNLDYGAGPTFSIVWCNNNGIVYAPWHGSAVALPWDGNSVSLKLDGGYQGRLIRSYDTGDGWTGGHQMMVHGSGIMGFWWPNGGFVYWYINWSDRRLKRNIKPASIDALGQINRLTFHELDLLPPVPHAVSQHWDCALIADEVEEVIPLAVARHGGGYAQINELPLVATMARAIQQLTARIEQLELAQQQRTH